VGEGGGEPVRRLYYASANLKNARRGIFVMTTSALNLIWGNKPGCSRAVAEVWIGREHLWFTLFKDEDDSKLKIELLPMLWNAATNLVLDFGEAERLMDVAKRELLAMSK
jgi:hypothetical protein